MSAFLTPNRTRWLNAAAAGYVILLTAWVASRWLASHGQLNAPGWAMLLPVQAAAAISMIRLLRSMRLAPSRRIGWLLLTASVVVDMLAIVDWSYVFASDPTPLGSFADVLYFANYMLLTGACIAFFISCGGDPHSPRAWLDGTTLALGGVAGVIPFFIEPLLGHVVPPTERVVATLGYGTGIVTTSAAALLLLTQIRNWRRERAMIGVALAIGVGLVTDLGSIAANVRGYFLLANFDDLGGCWSQVLFISAVLAERSGGPTTAAAPSDGPKWSFVPVFSLLLALSVVLAATVAPLGASRHIAAAVILAGAGILLVRHLALRYQFNRLSAALAARESDARITELVRSSRDQFVVVGENGRISFASSRAEEWLGKDAPQLGGRPASTLLGIANMRILTALIHQARVARGEPVQTEAEVTTGTDRPRTIQIVGRCESRNPHIRGVVLTLRDVTDQRSAERAIIEVAARERREMAHEVHEVIGQELAGIAYTIQSLATARGSDVGDLQASLDSVADDVRRAIADLQSLARELAPLAVFHGSLEAALDHFGTVVERRSGIRVRIIIENGGGNAIGPAEDLYYFARAAIERASAQSRCQAITVEIRTEANALALSVRDDAPVDPLRAAESGDSSWQLLDSRARLMGGALAIERMQGMGTHLSLRIPLRLRSSSLDGLLRTSS